MKRCNVCGLWTMNLAGFYPLTGYYCPRCKHIACKWRLEIQYAYSLLEQACLSLGLFEELRDLLLHMQKSYVRLALVPNLTTVKSDDVLIYLLGTDDNECTSIDKIVIGVINIEGVSYLMYEVEHDKASVLRFLYSSNNTPIISNLTDEQKRYTKDEGLDDAIKILKRKILVKEMERVKHG